MKRNVFLIIFIIFQTISSIGSTEEAVSKENALSKATDFVVKNTLPSFVIQVVAEPELITDEENNIAYIFNLKPAGFVIISVNKKVSPVLAYSFQNDFALPGSDEEKIAFSIIKNIYRNDLAKNSEVQTPNKNAAVFETGPFVQSIWGQVNCHDDQGNLVNVTNYYTPNHYAAGCVAISMVTLMQHYIWPINGTGSHTYTDNWGSSTGTYSADFEDTFYSWANMLDKYNNQASTTWQREAAGLLTYQSAVALNMDFEYNGSTSNVNRIPDAGKNYFRYSSIKRQYNTGSFWQILDSNIVHRIPVILAIKASNGAGHSIVCDGLRIEEDETYYYHLNNGWWGSANGWYRIREGSLGGGYNEITDGVFYFLPIPALSTPIVSENAEEATLNWQYPVSELQVDAYELQQKTGNGEWETLADDIQDTTYTVNIDYSKTYSFRVRVEVEGRWSTESWSNEENMGYVSMDEISDLDNITIGPNPFDNYLYVQTPSAGSSLTKISFATMDGKYIFKQDITGSSTINVDTQTWNPGVYILVLENKTSRKAVKIVKK